MSNGPLFGTGTFLWGLAAICQIHKLPFAPSLILQQFAPPYSAASLQEAAEALKLKSGLRAVKPAELRALPAPFLAILKPVESAADAARAEHLASRIALVLECDAASVLYLTESATQPNSEGLAQFGTQYAGLVLLCKPQARTAIDDDPATPTQREFGFSWFIPELLKYKAIWRDVLLASFAIQLVALAAPLCTQVVIDKVVVHHTQSTLLVIAIALAVFLVFNAVMSWVRQHLVLHTGNRVDAVLGARAFERLLQLPIRYFEQRPTGVLVARLHGIETIREFVSGAVVSLILDLPFLFIFLAVMFYYSWLLTLVTIAIMVVIVVISLSIVPGIRARLNKQFLLGARNTAFLTEYVSAMDTVKSLQMEPQLRDRFGGNLAAYLDAGFHARQLSNSYNVAVTGLEQLLMFAILCAGAWLVMQDAGFTVGMLVAYQMFASRVSQPMLRLAGLWQELQQAAIAVRRLGDIMNAPPEPHSVLPAHAAPVAGSIEADDLSFRYADDCPFLYEHFAFRVAAGECIAIMGASGSGKSTLAKLLQGFYLPTHGEIRIGARSTRHIPANELRLSFGVVPQETRLFCGTIYENLVLANPHATFEQVVYACRMAEIHESIERLNEGYQTQLGEHGAGLSGGQKQRIAIARALLKRPKILIFDEATSNLDHETAEQFARTINQLKGKVTMLFIAHELPPSLQVDRVVSLDR